MSWGNMGALALSSETAKYMFRGMNCQCGSGVKPKKQQHLT